MTLRKGLHKLERSREDLAWASGLFEGEGTAGAVKQRNRLYARAKVNMTDQDRVARFREVLGTGNLYGPYQQPNGWKDQWVIQWEGLEQVQALACMLWPWLGPRRRQQFVNAISLHGQRIEGSAQIG